MNDALEEHILAGYRIAKFASAHKDILEQIATAIAPREAEILDGWVSRQCKAWEPPGLTRDDLRKTFGNLLRSIIQGMQTRELERCLVLLEDASTTLAHRAFPFEALIISIHFLEESYIPFILATKGADTQAWLLTMDEFLHSAIASIATSYFEAYRREILGQAEVGRIVQEGLLANIPKRTCDLEVAHTYISASERARLGGDFLDFFVTDDHEVAFIIGDLCGHGLEAAANSVMLRSLFRGFMREKPDLVDAMSRLNYVLASELEMDLFATALALTYDSQGTISVVNAGHPSPMVYGQGCHAVESEGCVLAANEKSKYSLVKTQLEPGGLFVAFTDGLIEARNGVSMFGEERVARIIEEMRYESARAVVDRLIDESLRHAGGKFTDDVALLVLRRNE